MWMRISHEGLRENRFAVLSITGVNLRAGVYVRLDECLQYEGFIELHLFDISELTDSVGSMSGHFYTLIHAWSCSSIVTINER